MTFHKLFVALCREKGVRVSEIERPGVYLGAQGTMVTVIPQPPHGTLIGGHLTFFRPDPAAGEVDRT